MKCKAKSPWHSASETSAFEVNVDANTQVRVYGRQNAETGGVILRAEIWRHEPYSFEAESEQDREHD